MAIYWPSTLPDKHFVGLTSQLVYAPQPAVVRSQVDAGPAKMRPRFTARTTNIAIPVLFTGAQASALIAFHDSTLSMGSLAFTWRDAMSDAQISMRFVSPPAWTADPSAGAAPSRLWEATLSLEILP